MKNLSLKKMSRALATIWLSSLIVLFVVGCTVIPKTAKDNVASYDGAVQNSGFLGYDTNGYGYITPHARDRYNFLVENYSVRYQPPLKADDGITPGVVGTPLFDGSKRIGTAPTNSFRIDPERLVDFKEMNGWKKSTVPK